MSEAEIVPRMEVSEVPFAADLGAIRRERASLARSASTIRSGVAGNDVTRTPTAS